MTRIFGRCVLLALALFLLSAAAAMHPRTAAAGEVPEAVSDCLECHEDTELERETDRGEVMDLFVDEESFGNSVHRRMGCRGCHRGVDLDTHPEERPIASRDAFRVEASRACDRCHARRRLQEEPMHRYLVTDAGAPPCAACHDAHTMGRVKGWKASLEEREYCLTCHKESIRLGLGNGEKMQLRMEDDLLKASVHSDHDCSDCHQDFSKTAHAVEEFSSRRNHTIATVEACRMCHDEMFEVFEGSIHSSMLARGNLAAPVCTDCHGYHSVGPKSTLEEIAGIPCRRCHEEVFEIYSESMHGEAREKKGHLEAPICADCHRAHEVSAADWTTRLREACVKCHDTAPARHEEWLPNAGLHLDAVACPACHAPTAERRIELKLYDEKSGKPITEDRLRALAGGELRPGIVTEGLGAFELWNLLRAANAGKGEEKVAILGSLEVRSGLDAHRLSGKGAALADCSACHGGDAAPFADVTISLTRNDGRPLHYAAGKELLNSAASLGSVRNFYALGSTRIKLLDLLLVLAVLGGMSVPALHMTARLLLRKR